MYIYHLPFASGTSEVNYFDTVSRVHHHVVGSKENDLELILKVKYICICNILHVPVNNGTGVYEVQPFDKTVSIL